MWGGGGVGTWRHWFWQKTGVPGRTEGLRRFHCYGEWKRGCQWSWEWIQTLRRPGGESGVRSGKEEAGEREPEQAGVDYFCTAGPGTGVEFGGCIAINRIYNT